MIKDGTSDRRIFGKALRERGLGAWLSFRREKVPGTAPIAMLEREDGTSKTS
jgi:hypothetical protein